MAETAKAMKQLIKNLEIDKTKNSSASTCTDLADSLDLLSSGIYTEEERFIYELLQNAVDAFEGAKDDCLHIRIVCRDGYIVFMHNGTPFSERDIVGLCSVGNGNKTRNVKKIGYKGIGFKSVFMHSPKVTIRSEDTLFRFDKDYWEDFKFDGKSHDRYGRKYRLPWQIIPLLTDKDPLDIDTQDYNVVTYIKTDRMESLRRKIEQMLGGCQFLLFLGSNSIEIELYDEDKLVRSLKKRISEQKKLSNESEHQKVISLYDNGEIDSKWLVYQNDAVAVPEAVKTEISTDSKVPTKLKELDTFDVAFAIRIDDNGNIEPVNNSVLYTYLPTSYGFGLPFLLNANFITDAGRQQINTDSVWNMMIVESFPKLFFAWVASFSRETPDYYKVMPKKRNASDAVSQSYNDALIDAINTIPFIPNTTGEKLLKSPEAFCDPYSFENAVTEARFSSVVSSLWGIGFGENNRVGKDLGELPVYYDVKSLDKREMLSIIDGSDELYDRITEDENVTLLHWIKECSIFVESEAIRFLSNMRILLDENGDLVKPVDTFFPSDYMDENSMAADAHILSNEVYDSLSTEDVAWLKNLGVNEMSNISVIKNIICRPGFITADNSVKVIRFIFDVFGTSDFVGYDKEITWDEVSYLQLLTKDGKLHNPSMVYLSEDYGVSLCLDRFGGEQYTLSSEYMQPDDNPTEWRLFFENLGVHNEIKVTSITYERGDYVFRTLNRCVEYAERNESNYSSWTGKNYYMWSSKIRVKLKFPCLLSLDSSNYIFNKYVWEEVLCKGISLNRESDYIYGPTGYGYTKKAYLCDNEEGHRYLGENFLPWALKNYPLLPGSDGRLHKVQEILENTDENKDMCGSYYPVLDVEKPIDPSWKKYMAFKQNLSLSECLAILEGISYDKDAETIAANKERISRLYAYIADNFCNHISSEDTALLARWGRVHKMLSKDDRFIELSELVFVSEDLGKIDDVDNQIYKGKYVGNRNDRFVSFLKAVGVRFIDKYEPVFEGNRTEDVSFEQSLQDKMPYIVLLCAGKEAGHDVYENTFAEVKDVLNAIKFYRQDALYLNFGGTRIKKQMIVDGNNFYHVGSMTLAIREMMLYDLAKKLKVIPDRTILFAILQMSDLSEIRSYMEMKEYSVDYVPEEVSPTIVNAKPSDTEDRNTNECSRHNVMMETSEGSMVEISIYEPQYGGLSEQEMRDALIEAKEAVKQHLEGMGYTFTQGICEDAWCNIYGVISPEGKETPLVVHSYKDRTRLFALNASDWEQLSQDGAMLWVVTSDGPQCVPFFALPSNDSTICITFSAENMQYKDRCVVLAETLRYFKGLQFQLGSNIIRDSRPQLFNSSTDKSKPVVESMRKMFGKPEQSENKPVAGANENALL